MDFISRKFLIVASVFILFLSGCNSTPPTSTRDTKTVSAKRIALNEAFEARGFYLSSLNNINYLNAKQCGDYQLQSHRGSIRHPENSVNAVIDAIDNGFDVVEIDVRVTFDGVWVVHHDKQTGRETGTIDNKRRKIERIRYEKEWGYLRARDQNSGQLLNVLPPDFRTLAKAFASIAGLSKKLNIEIKSDASTKELEMLDYLAFKIIGQGRYFYSSLSLRNLERMRDINSQVFLSFIQSPAEQSMRVLKAKLEKGASSDNIYQDNQERIEDIAGFAFRRYKEKRYDSSSGISKLKKALKRNFGLAIDIRQYVGQASRIKSLVSSYGIPVATYTINDHAYHANSLFKIASNSRPDSVIIDDTLYGFCSQYGLPAMQTYIGSTDHTKRIALLPIDLDLERLDEVDTYFDNGLYPALGGQLKTINNDVTSPAFIPVMLELKAGPKERESEVDLKTDRAVEVDLRNSNDAPFL